MHDIPSTDEVHEAMKDFYDEILPKEPIVPEIVEPYEIIQEPEDLEPVETEKPKPKPVEVEEPAFVSPVPKSEDEANAWAILTLLFQNPFLKWNEIRTETRLTESKAGKARAWLETNNMAKPQSVKLVTKPGLYLEIQNWVYLKYGKKPPKGKGGFEHKCHVDHIKTWLEDRGFNAWIEASNIDGMRGSFDILAWIQHSKGNMYGFEITHSFGNLISNIEDGLRSKVKKLFIVCKDHNDMKKSENIAKKYIKNTSRLEFRQISYFSKQLKSL